MTSLQTQAETDQQNIKKKKKERKRHTMLKVTMETSESSEQLKQPDFAAENWYSAVVPSLDPETALPLRLLADSISSPDAHRTSLLRFYNNTKNQPKSNITDKK